MYEYLLVSIPNPNCPPEKCISIYQFYELLQTFANMGHFSFKSLPPNTCEHENRVMHFAGAPWGTQGSQALSVRMDMLIYLSGHVLASLEKEAPIYHIMWWHSTTQQTQISHTVECCLPSWRARNRTSAIFASAIFQGQVQRPALR